MSSVILRDLRQGLRRLWSQPAFTAVVVLTLALGIGATSAIFSVVEAVLLSPLPYPGSDTLVAIEYQERKTGELRPYVSPPNFYDWQDESRAFESMAGYWNTQVTLSRPEGAQRVQVARVTASLFPTLRSEPRLGRAISPEEDQPGGPKTVILSHDFWQRELGGDPGVLGRSLRLRGENHEVIGVMGPDFDFPDLRTDAWIAAQLPRAQGDLAGISYRAFEYFAVIARRVEGISLEAARADMESLSGRLEELHPAENEGLVARVEPLRDKLTGDVRPALWILLGVSVFVLLLASFNVANFFLVKATGRTQEMALRMALGAGKRDLIRQLLVESTLFALAGGVLGFGLAQFSLDTLLGLAGKALPRVHEIGVDPVVLLVTGVIALCTTLVFGLVPALYAVRTAPSAVLRSGNRGGSSSGVRRLQGLLVSLEIALALPLLIGSGLLIKSLSQLQSVDPGFVTERILTLEVSLPLEEYRERYLSTQFFDQLLARVRALPGVSSAGAVLQLPLVGLDVDRSAVHLDGAMSERDERPKTARILLVTPGYFEALGIALEKGRTFSELDTWDAPGAVIVNQAMVREFWPDRDPLGRELTHDVRLYPDEPSPRRVVGVVDDVLHFGLSSEPEPLMYLPYAQSPWDPMSLVVRTESEPRALVSAIRESVREIDASVPVSGVRTLESIVADSIRLPRFRTLLFGLFAGTALILAALGLYGVLAFAVSQRSRELAVRMALGSSRGRIVSLVLGKAAALVALGSAAGLAGAFFLSRVLGGLLFRVETFDLAIFFATPLLLAAVAALASLLPALRATRVEPAEVLRGE